MREKKFIFSAVILSGTLALGIPAAWSQGIGETAPAPEKMEPQQEPSPSIPQSSEGSSVGGSEGAQQESEAIQQEAGDGNIKEVQQALKEQGYDPGPVDGVLGPKTEEALKSFQQANGLEATGKLDAQTAQKLGLENGARHESGSQPETGSRPETGGQQESGGQKSM